MTAIAGDMPHWELRSAKRDRVVICSEQTIGAAGAVGTLVTDDPGVTVAKNASAGTYDIAFPKAHRASVYCSVVSPAGTVKTVSVVALSASAGTAQLVTNNAAGAATNPATSDVLLFELLLDMRSDA